MFHVCTIGITNAGGEGKGRGGEGSRVSFHQVSDCVRSRLRCTWNLPCRCNCSQRILKHAKYIVGFADKDGTQNTTQMSLW
jgi:hypothetical protein